MPPIASIKRRDLMPALRRLGFTGPYFGGKHEFMRRRQRVVRLTILIRETSALGY